MLDSVLQICIQHKIQENNRQDVIIEVEREQGGVWPSYVQEHEQDVRHVVAAVARRFTTGARR